MGPEGFSISIEMIKIFEPPTFGFLSLEDNTNFLEARRPTRYPSYTTNPILIM